MKRQWLKIAVLLATVLINGSVWAHHRDGTESQHAVPQWYQIEVLVFSQITPEAENAERWRKETGYSFPDDMVSLSSPQFPQETAVWLDKAASERRLYPFLSEEDSENTKSALVAFTPLSAEEQQLNGIADRMKQSALYRPLFHEVWRQPLAKGNAEPAVLVLGGESYRDTHELQGSIRLSLSRYLHVHADLLLTQFEENHGQLQEDWPIVTLPFQLPDFSRPIIDSLALNNENDEYDLLSKLPDSITRTEKIVRRVVRLNQTRRMRSNELHYLDHPLFGVLIKTIPYDSLS